MRILLILSVAVNIFVASAIAGGSYMWVRGNQAFGVGANWRREAGVALPPQDREAYRQMIRQTMRDAQPIFGRAAEARREAARLFVQPQFDAAAVNAALAQARVADVQLRTQLEERIVGFAAKLSFEDRRILAEGLSPGPLRQRTSDKGKSPTASPGSH
jgi:uncharacterized membrane protein